MFKNYQLLKKSNLRRINISELEMDLPDLKNITESKALAISKWLTDMIENNTKSGKLKINDILPSKSDFAYYLGVSTGTMQNAFRQIEDLGYVESKQCIGTIIKDKASHNTIRKLTSKRELAVDAVKRYILTEAYKVGYLLPSSRIVAQSIGHSQNTTRLALEYLTSQGILKHKYRNSNETGWYVNNIDFQIDANLEKSETLVEIVAKDIEKYISDNLSVGDKMPPHATLAQNLKASIKTVHDALKILINRGIILARRGKYGTYVLKNPNKTEKSFKVEESIFAPASDAAFYHYEKTQNKIRKMIADEYEIGDKLPSIMEISKKFDLSPNTIRKAFHNLAKEGYLVFSRGRYGGTFVIDIPEQEESSFKWLAVNPSFKKDFENIIEN